MAKSAAYIVLPALLLMGVACGGRGSGARDQPRRRMAVPLAHTDHSPLIKGPFKDAHEVTRTCLECHPESAAEVMKTSHWTWMGDSDERGGKTVRFGKRNVINNFCVGIQSNWPRCTSCHAGYGWKDESFDFTRAENVDCLVCHDTTGLYQKGPASSGYPAENVDLAAVAKGVGVPSRQNCGYCHFSGGGGDAVKHGDLDQTMTHPARRVDVHMGRHGLRCQDCHRTSAHVISGRNMPVSEPERDRARCSDCHSTEPHAEERLDAHARTLACQACHMPFTAKDTATKMSWDWSTAGRDLKPADPKTYSKMKGTFTFGRMIKPEYQWWNGASARYLPGDKIDPQAITTLLRPLGGIEDPVAKIWPFKVHRGKQVYDKKHRHLLVPKTYGEGGYWTEYDWGKALRLGSAASGLAFSGKYGFTRTRTFIPQTHMVAEKDGPLMCVDCHVEGGRMDWRALGYDGDPASAGGRRKTGLLGKAEEEKL